MKLKTRQNQKLKSYLKSHRGKQATAPSPSTYTSYVINFEEATFKKIMREGLQAYEEMVRLNQEMWEMLIKEFIPHLQVVEVQLSQGFSKIANSPEMQEAVRLYDAIRQKPVYEDLPTLLASALGEPSEVKETPTGRIYVFNPETGDPPKYVSEGFIYTDFKPHTPVEENDNGLENI